MNDAENGIKNRAYTSSAVKSPPPSNPIVGSDVRRLEPIPLKIEIKKIKNIVLCN